MARHAVGVDGEQEARAVPGARPLRRVGAEASHNDSAA
jgi:hypothetical protein